ncbi:hypothetical protein [Streptomyces sp. NPDC091259]|uniref:hypothetical protein n=1 Tax=Streptomyces sp. NPDC091259 TaxID=3365976 RepID=UPI0037F1DED7
MNHRSDRVVGFAVAAIVGLVACGSGKPSDGTAPGPRSSAVPAYVTAYRAGYTAGKAVYDSSGKGAAVRETIWGGCTRRALDAGSSAEMDRGSWVRGCHHGVSNAPARLPTGPATKRTTDSRLLEQFRTWARTKGEAQRVDHIRRLETAQLTELDYDIEVYTDYPAGLGRAESEALAHSFVAWWDGDHGRDGFARNILIFGADGKRLIAQRI